jgi:hypothetical protein
MLSQSTFKHAFARAIPRKFVPFVVRHKAALARQDFGPRGCLDLTEKKLQRWPINNKSDQQTVEARLIVLCVLLIV